MDRSFAVKEIRIKKRNSRHDDAPLHLPPAFCPRGTAQQRILDLEVVILLYSYNPVQSCGTLETFTSLSKYRSDKSIFPLKFHPNLDPIRDRDLIRGCLTILYSTNFKRKIPQPRSIPFRSLRKLAVIAHLQGGLLPESYKTHRRVGAVFRRECPGIQTYFWFENKFR